MPPHLLTDRHPTHRLVSEILHPPPCRQDHHEEEDRAQDIRKSQADLAQEPAGNGPHQQSRAGDRLPSPEDSLHASLVTGGFERVDEPGFGGPGEEGETEPDQGRDQDPPPDACLHVPEPEIGSGGHHQGRRSQDERDATPEGVGDHTCRHLEDHHPCRVGGIGDECLGQAEPGIEQEQGVDPPDQRGGQCLEEDQGQVGPLHCLGGGHGRTHRGIDSS